MPRQFRLAFLFAFVFGASLTAGAVTEDTQFWSLNFAQVKFHKHWGGYLEVQPRYGDDVGRLDRVLIRPAVVYFLGPTRALYAGYLKMPVESVPRVHEHRYWLQYVEFWKFGDGKLTNRSRFEVRDLPRLSDEGYRVREMLRYAHPISAGSSWSGVVWDEIFFNLNSVDRGPRSGFDQNRFFVGIEKRFSPEFAAELGYLHNYINNSSPREDHVNHAALLMLTYIQ